MIDSSPEDFGDEIGALQQLLRDQFQMFVLLYVDKLTDLEKGPGSILDLTSINESII
jgi:hypothetical protein